MLRLSELFGSALGIRRLTAWQVSQSSRSAAFEQKIKTPTVQPCSHALRGCWRVHPSHVIEQISDLLRSFPIDELTISTRHQTLSVGQLHLRQTSNRSNIAHAVLCCKKNPQEVSLKYTCICLNNFEKSSSTRSYGI